MKTKGRKPMSLVRSDSAVHTVLSSSSKKKVVTFNLTRNERHTYESQKSIEQTAGEDLHDKELEMALESGKLSQEDMMKELLELCGWNNADEDEDCSRSSHTPSDSGGSFSCGFSSSQESFNYDFSSSQETDASEPSTPTRSPSRLRSRQASILSLKLDSLRLSSSPYSRPQKLSRLPSVGRGGKMPRQQASWWDDISNGIMREDSLPVEVQKEEPYSPKDEVDFWNDVEF